MNFVESLKKLVQEWLITEGVNVFLARDILPAGIVEIVEQASVIYVKKALELAYKEAEHLQNTW